MATRNDDCVETYKFSVVTKNPCFKVEFDWEIENCHYNDVSSLFLSPEILLPGITWQFGLKNKPGTLLYDIFIRTSCDHFLFISGRCVYGSSEFFVHKSISKGDNVISEEKLVSAEDFTAKLKVYGFNRKSFFLNEISNQNQTNSLAPCHSNDHFLYSKNFLDKIKSMWQKKPTDLRILVEGKHILVHKFILLAMSPVLAFKPTVEEENTEDTIPICGTSFEVMESLIKFMYGLFPDDEILGNWDKLCELYHASDHYKVLDLRDLCGRTMIKKLTIENAGEVMAISHRHMDGALMKPVAGFCYKNFKEVAETDAWKNCVKENPAVECLLGWFAESNE